MLLKSRKWIADMDAVLTLLPELEKIKDKSILITGAAGLVCSAVVDLIHRFNDLTHSNIHVFAAGRWSGEMTKRFGDQTQRRDFSFVEYDASRADNHIKVKADYIIHGASNASPALITKEPVETMLSNFLGLKCLLDYAKETEAKRLLYISSSEVYGIKTGCEPFKEGEYGYIDLLNSRNSYSVGKRAAETLCVSYSAEYGTECVIVRPGHIYGPTASPFDNRVSSAWAYNAARGEDIVMKSNGEQIRSYCYCLDCASAILKVLFCGENNYAYNISNPNSVITIHELAEILAKAGGVKLRMESPNEDEKSGFNPMSNSSLESKSLNELGWNGCFNAETGLVHTVDIIKEVIP